MNYLDQINKDLGGQNGLIYLMFLGRKTTGDNIIQELKYVKNRKFGYSILADPDDQVYAATSFLTKKGYIHQVDKKGRHKFRTAKLEPIIETLQQHELPFNKKIITITGKGMHVFPIYVSVNFQARRTTIKHKDWDFLFTSLYKPFFTDLAAFAYGRTLGGGSNQNIIKMMSNFTVNLRIPSKKVREKVLEAFDTQLNLLNTFTQDEVKELSNYVGKMYSKALKNSFALTQKLTPKEEKDFDKFFESIFMGNFSDKQMMVACDKFFKHLMSDRKT